MGSGSAGRILMSELRRGEVRCSLQLTGATKIFVQLPVISDYQGCQAVREKTLMIFIARAVRAFVSVISNYPHYISGVKLVLSNEI